MTDLEYKRYLRTETWKHKKQEREKIDHHVCQICGSSGTRLNPLEIHHLSYRHIGNENIYTDLVTVCNSCHKGIHKMMNRVTNENGRRGWKDTLSCSNVGVSNEKQFTNFHEI